MQQSQNLHDAANRSTGWGRFLTNASWVERVRHITPFAIGLVTFGTLALELALIRWTSSQIRIFAYFNNVVLICAFLGIGLGIGLGRRFPGLIRTVVPLTFLLSLPLAFSEKFGLVNMPFPDQSIMLWGAQVAGDVWVFARNIGIFLSLLALITLVFVGCGAPLGYLFAHSSALRAYHADLVGSLCGVLAFTLLAWFNATPPIWIALGILPFVLLTFTPLSIAASLVVIWISHLSVGAALFSPYNRIDVFLGLGNNFELRVNRDFHQYMFDLSDRRLAEPGRPDGLPQLRQLYDLPFVLNPKRDRAVVVGAGTGNDVQAAIRNGYKHVSSVDIDGRIIELGRLLHPEKPYDNSAAVPVVDDARAFFEKNKGRTFDVVCFGLLDSHAMSSAMSTLRLDNYVYTEEGIRAAWRLVGPEGHLSLAISCMAGRWFFERLYWTVTRATGVEPIAFYSSLHSGTVTFVVPGPSANLIKSIVDSRPKVTPESPMEHTLTTSDDWPFLYIRPGTIPWGYAVVLVAILIGAVVSVRRVYGFHLKKDAFHWPLFFMGAAFLLVETRGVTSLSLLFGSTWMVNSAVFGGILVMVILGNLIVRRTQWQNFQVCFILLFAAIILLYLFPVSSLHGLPLVTRAILGGLMTGLPIGLAGLIVPMLLARAKDPAMALGANLLGSVLGGCLEYFSMLGGLRATALLALILYLLAYLAIRRHLLSAMKDHAVAEPIVIRPTPDVTC